MVSKTDLTYGSHLKLDRLLAAQEPVSESHDELLFITQHQTSELWFKLVIAELEEARSCLGAGDLAGSRKPLRRVAVVLDHLVSSWNVLRCLGPLDFAGFRGSLGSASGFQSWQYRLVEFALGNRVPAMIEPHRAAGGVAALLEAELSRPSLYHCALKLLEIELDRGFNSEAFRFDRIYRSQDDVLDAWATVYADAGTHRDLFDLAEQLIEIEDRFRCWRFNHVTSVERVIGSKRGTGGTDGVGYLRGMLDQSFFPELWEVRSRL